MAGLYPPVEPFSEGFLDVGHGHRVHYEICGNPTGKPVVFVHGGPGAGCDTRSRRFFDPAVYKIVLFDQRGCGKSTPYAGLEHNTTWDLVADMELLRHAVGVESWVVFGGSWGSTLALAYAETHPARVKALILRGVCMMRPAELRWLYQEGASFIFPDAWDDFLEPIPTEERGDLIAAYHRRLTSENNEVKHGAARAWSIWEGRVSKLLEDPDLVAHCAGNDYAVAIARIEVHYFMCRGFFEHDDELLRGVERIRHIPTIMVQGRYDLVCPVQTAWDLHRAFPEAELVVVPGAGHSSSEPGIVAALIAATDRFGREA